MSQDFKLARKMWQSGAPIKEIAVALGRKPGAMKQQIRRWRKVDPDGFAERKGWDPTLAIKLWKDLNRTYTISEIAEQYGIEEHVLSKRIRRWRKKHPEDFPNRYNKKSHNDWVEEAKLAQNLWEKKAPVSEIAKAYGVPEKRMNDIIYNWRKKIPGWFKVRIAEARSYQHRIKTRARYKDEAEFFHKLWFLGVNKKDMSDIDDSTYSAFKQKVIRWKRYLNWFKQEEKGKDQEYAYYLYNIGLPLYDISLRLGISEEILEKFVFKKLKPRKRKTRLQLSSDALEDVFFLLYSVGSLEEIANKLNTYPVVLAHYLYENKVYDDMLKFNKSILKNVQDRASLMDRANRFFGIRTRGELNRLIMTWGDIQDVVLEHWPDSRLPIPNPIQDIVAHYESLGLGNEEIDILLGL